MTAEQKWRWKFAVICSVPVSILDVLCPGHVGLFIVIVILLGCAAAIYSIKRWP